MAHALLVQERMREEDQTTQRTETRGDDRHWPEFYWEEMERDAGSSSDGEAIQKYE